MSYSAATIWTIIALLGAGTFLIRFSFLGLIGDRKLPPWLLRHLRYTPVAVLPGMIAPLVAWPEATGGETDPVRLGAAAATLILGRVTQNVVLTIFGGAGVLAAGLYVWP